MLKSNLHYFIWLVVVLFEVLELLLHDVVWVDIKLLANLKSFLVELGLSGRSVNQFLEVLLQGLGMEDLEVIAH